MTQIDGNCGHSPAPITDFNRGMEICFTDKARDVARKWRTLGECFIDVERSKVQVPSGLGA